MSVKFKKDDFISKSIKIHGDKYDYSLINYINMKTNIKIICDKHGLFEQRPDLHLKKGCKDCFISERGIRTFLKKAKEIHENKYDYDIYSYINRTSKIIIKCKEHGDFLQTPHKHLQGRGCPYCNGGISSNIDDFIKKANIIHNNKYLYNESVYINNFINIKITCKRHGNFSKSPKSHLNGFGCPKCLIHKNKKDIKDVIDDFSKIHKNKYDYSLVEYINNIVKVKIICKEHGVFNQSPMKHLKGQGCPTCGSKFGIKENRWLDYLDIKERQVRIGKYIVDGYDSMTNTIYEFNGDFWHGNPK